jgi:colicin import membrane protein
MSKKLAEEQVEWDLHENTEALIPLEFTEEIKPDLFGLEVSKATEMVSGLSVALAEREVLKNAYIDVIELPITTETLPTFKELRLKIVKNRTQGIEKWHKTNKAFYLAGGRFVDAVKNKEIVINEEMEAKLMEAEKFFENQEKEKARLLNLERIEKIRPYVEDADNMNFSEFDDESFDDFVLGKKTRFENEAKEREAELLRIETERLAEIERQKAIQEENDRLKKDAEEKEKALAEERKLQAEKEAKLKVEQDLILQKERLERVKIEAELQQKKESEIKAENERLEKEKTEKLQSEKLAKAPIKKQLSVWVNSFEIESTSIDNETSKQIKEKFEAFKKWSLQQVENL